MSENSCSDCSAKTALGGMSLVELENHIDRRVKQRLDEYMIVQAKGLDARFDELKDLLKSAFPGGDPIQHKMYHDEAIAFMQERRRLWQSVREKTLTGLVWMGLTALGAAVWSYVKAKMGAPV